MSRASPLLGRTQSGWANDLAASHPHLRSAVARCAIPIPKGLIICKTSPAAESWVMRPQKITFGEMRSSGVRGVLVYCSDYRCSHSIAMPADRWPDDVRLSDIELRFVCKA